MCVTGVVASWGGFECFESVGGFERASIVLGSELWEDYISSMFDLVKEYIADYVGVIYGAFHCPSLRIYLGNWGMFGAVVG